MSLSAKTMKRLYGLAEGSQVKSLITCPACYRGIIKKRPDHKFCDRVCKDAYWNNVDPRKRNNTTRISPASARYMASRPVREPDFDDDPSWDAHKDY